MSQGATGRLSVRPSDRPVFLTGSTGYMGSRLIPQLIKRGHAVHALARPGAEPRLPPGCTPVTGDALNRTSYQAQVPRGATFVHLIGTSHPSPAKAPLFRSVDLASVHEAVAAATTAGVSHFVYVSVAHPAPIMRAYIEARIEAEAVI